MRIIDVCSSHRSSLYLRVRLPILLTIAAILGLRAYGDSTLLPLVLSGSLVVLAFYGRWLTASAPQERRLFCPVLAAEVGACIVATLYYGLFSILGVLFGIILISSFQSFASRARTGVYTALLLCFTLLSGHILLGGIGHSAVLTLAAIIMATGAIAIVFSSRLERMTSTIEQMRVALDKQKLNGEATSENIVRLYEASQATSQEAEPGGIMDTLVEDARRLVGCESASVALFIEKDLLASVSKGISQEFKRNLRWRVRKGGMTDWVLTTGKPLIVNHAQTDPRSRDSSAVKIGKLESIMAMPLATGDEVFGILYVGDTHDKGFGDHDLMLLTILANHAAASIKQTRLRRELKKKLEELEAAHKELIGADRLKAEFISAVTSQMRVPLDAIKTYSQTVLQRMDDEAFRLKKKFLGAVVEETAKLLNTVNGVIDLSRMEFGEGDLRVEEANIAEIVRDACSVLEPIYMDNQIEIVVDAPPDLSYARLDRGMIFLLFRNLLEAAISFAKESTRVRITLAEDQSFLTTRISLAPAPSTLEIESVVRAVSGKGAIPSEAGSLGLTLQVAKNIVFRHGGRIWAETHDPSSWSFVVLFGKEKRAILPSDLMLEIMTSRPELKRMLALVADMISKVMSVGRCQLFLEDSTTGNLVLGASVNYDPPSQARLVVAAGEGLTGTVFQESKPMVLNSVMEVADSDIGETLPFERVPCTSVPIRLDGRVVGVLTVSDKQGSDLPFGENDLCLLAALGDRIAVAIERATSYESARDQFVSAMVAMRSLLEARRAPLAKANELGSLVVELGRSMGLGEEETRLLQYVSRIYDVGMVRVGEGILRKRGGLGVGEYESVKKHPEEGVDIVGPIEFLDQVKDVILHHHERYDGGGYPGGLSGESIPVGARILAVVDAYGSMISERPYRSAMVVEDALEELRRCSGTQFDPKVVEKFVDIVGGAEAGIRLQEKA